MGTLGPGEAEWPSCGRPGRPIQNLLLLLGALLSCDLGGGAQGPGEWTLWGSWSRCSSSCGRGVSVRSRRCIRLPGEDPCWGDTHGYRLCQLPDCPPGAVPFRDLQCALYNGRPVLGAPQTYQWVPFLGAPNQCDLNCLAEGHGFYRSFGRVLDGTPCGPAAQDLCVAGRCLSAGCDGLLGSGALEDRCGRCGGADDSCLCLRRVLERDPDPCGRKTRPRGAPQPQPPGSSCGSPTRASSWSFGSPRSATAPSRRGRRRWAGPCGSHSRGRWSLRPASPPAPRGPRPPPQSPARPARTPVGAPTGCSTTAAATLCSRPACWAAGATPRRRATRCGSSWSTRAAGRCGAASTCGRRAAAPARRWPPAGSTCWPCGASSAPTAPRTGCCCRGPATRGPGAPRRTAERAWPHATARPDARGGPAPLPAPPPRLRAWKSASLPPKDELAPWLWVFFLRSPCR
ncbi:ADAMTS-like protein 5 isoform X4 [Oryctolagus cuniculus]|uniref:ADAMTS-like protein 5 isoform X4 n=1 Tax=Oryctolagus cuniculus TaxID=9986 RepID=UPI00222FABC6|nr:ADAMTS-like protein 5 isoform X4 [Oryctolagus cuniculus]